MRFVKTCLAISAVLLFCSFIHSQDIEVITSKHIEALGGEDALGEIKSLKLTGTLEFSSSDVIYNLSIFKMHPNLYRYESEYRGTTIIEAYDGSEVWHINPFDGIDSPVPFEEEVNAARIKSEAYLISPLVDWKAEGYKVEYKGEQTGENGNWLHMKVTFNDDYTIDYFLDAETYLPGKMVRLERHNPRGRPILVTTHIRDYRRISNVLFAQRYEIEKGPQKMTITIKHTDINPKDLTSSFFSRK